MSIKRSPAFSYKAIKHVPLYDRVDNTLTNTLDIDYYSAVVSADVIEPFLRKMKTDVFFQSGCYGYGSNGADGIYPPRIDQCRFSRVYPKDRSEKWARYGTYTNKVDDIISLVHLEQHFYLKVTRRKGIWDIKFFGDYDKLLESPHAGGMIAILNLPADGVEHILLANKLRSNNIAPNEYNNKLVEHYRQIMEFVFDAGVGYIEDKLLENPKLIDEEYYNEFPDNGVLMSLCRVSRVAPRYYNLCRKVFKLLYLERHLLVKPRGINTVDEENEGNDTIPCMCGYRLRDVQF